jgi:tripartite motif-containing protein 71
MSDRFNFLEIGDSRPVAAPETGVNEVSSAPQATGWRPMRLRAVEVIGEAGTRPCQFSAPTGLAVDRDGALYVVDSNNHRVQRIALNGDVLVYGRPGNGPAQLWGAQSVAVHPGGQFFFVAEQGNNRVQCFHFNGQSRGALPGFRAPSGVAFDAEGHLWVADTGNARVVRINVQNGQCIGGMDRSVGIVRPINVATDAAGNIYVTDGVTNDVTRYTNFGLKAHALGEIRKLHAPQQVAVDAQGRIYLAEAGANRLHVFDGYGNSLITMETPMNKLGPFRSPAGVALGPQGEIYVSDTLNHRILRLSWE